jgi:hypothetical protein
MDTMHNWALWRILFIALLALPFLVSAVIVGFRQQHAKDSNASAQQDEGTASSAISGPGAWCVEGDKYVETRSVNNTAVLDQRAA